MTETDARRALLVIDVQNDYFPGGAFPLTGTDAALAATLTAMSRAEAAGDLIVLVRHVADESRGPAPFFRPGSAGAEIHPAVLAAAPAAPVSVKAAADAFHRTDLEEILAAHVVGELLICGMMTQNCVTHTAISKAAEKYAVKILADACCTVSDILHRIALSAAGLRVPVVPVAEIYPSGT